MKSFKIVYKTKSGDTLEFTQYANSIGEALQNFKLSRPDVEVIMICSAKPSGEYKPNSVYMKYPK